MATLGGHLGYQSVAKPVTKTKLCLVAEQLCHVVVIITAVLNTHHVHNQVSKNGGIYGTTAQHKIFQMAVKWQNHFFATCMVESAAKMIAARILSKRYYYILPLQRHLDGPSGDLPRPCAAPKWRSSPPPPRDPPPRSSTSWPGPAEFQEF